MKKALVIVDMQNDFCPGGALPVPEGDRIIPVINRLQARFSVILATQDWHPAGHQSFASQHPGKHPGDRIILGGLEQVLWPDHCVQGTKGADFVSGLVTNRFDRVFRKGTDLRVDSYSAFFDNARRKSTGFLEYLREAGINELYFAGLACDYCVCYSVLDACELGFRVNVLEDAVKGIDLAAGDSLRALEQMSKKGARILRSDSPEVIRLNV